MAAAVASVASVATCDCSQLTNMTVLYDFRAAISAQYASTLMQSKTSQLSGALFLFYGMACLSASRSFCHCGASVVNTPDEISMLF